MQWPPKFTTVWKNTSNVVLLTNPLTRLRGNGLSDQKTVFSSFLNLASLILHFGLVTILGVYVTSHSGQFFRLLLVSNTARVMWHNIIPRLGLDAKCDPSAPYWRHGPRNCAISRVNMCFGIITQGPRNVLAMIEVTVQWSQTHNFWSKSLQTMFYTVFRIRKSPSIDFIDQIHDICWNTAVIGKFPNFEIKSYGACYKIMHSLQIMHCRNFSH